MNITFHNKWVKVAFWTVVTIVAVYFVFSVIKPSASITLGVGQQNNTGK